VDAAAGEVLEAELVKLISPPASVLEEAMILDERLDKDGIELMLWIVELAAARDDCGDETVLPPAILVDEDGEEPVLDAKAVCIAEAGPDEELPEVDAEELWKSDEVVELGAAKSLGE
jgi:hypothetical protein